jgi:AbrB family looped-hinge helix DNA binding protein
MQAVVVRMSTKYQVVIPKPVREALGLRPHDRLLFLVDGDTVVLRPRPASFARTLRGLHQELWPDPDHWLEEERSSWA